MSWQDDYYLGSSDYPVTGADDDLDPTGDNELALTLASDDPALD